MADTLHLVRHGEVENPKGIIYGRLPGYHLSERGRRQAQQSAHQLRAAQVAAVRASPLERAQETAATIAAPHGLDVATDERLIESESTLEGMTRNALHLIRSPRQWSKFRNPLRPSWGESFHDIRARMLDVVADARGEAGDGEIVLVSHQTPVLVARLALTRRRTPPWIGLTPCETGSVTTLVLEGDDVVSVSYFRPPG